jgi:hypothetical protein
MPVSAGDFFPAEADWPFVEAALTNQLTLELRSHEEPAGRRIELNAPPSHNFTGFFDRMTVTPDGVELNRLHLQSQILNIDPPLLVRTDGKPTHVANLFPGLVGDFPNSMAPYDGSVARNEIKDVTVPGTHEQDVIWKFQLKSFSAERHNVFEPNFLFSLKYGLVFYHGQVYGVFFFYERRDVGKLYKPFFA